MLLEIAAWGQDSARFPGLLGSWDGLSCPTEYGKVNFVIVKRRMHSSLVKQPESHSYSYFVKL